MNFLVDGLAWRSSISHCIDNGFSQGSCRQPEYHHIGNPSIIARKNPVQKFFSFKVMTRERKSMAELILFVVVNKQFCYPISKKLVVASLSDFRKMVRKFQNCELTVLTNFFIHFILLVITDKRRLTAPFSIVDACSSIKKISPID
ncbi:hypothetical protein J6590_041613 [Homalodisca vitripennis]|nr:hypothetical protein J6590_041613 [Homalodisca vitripennis]